MEIENEIPATKARRPIKEIKHNVILTEGQRALLQLNTVLEDFTVPAGKVLVLRVEITGHLEDAPEA